MSPARVKPYYSKKNGHVHHICSRCTEDNNIEPENKASGTGGLPVCRKCREPVAKRVC